MRKTINAQPEQSNPANFFEGVSIRPLDRLAHLIHEHGDTFSDKDLSGFNTALESDAHQVKELISALGDVYQNAPCLGSGQEIDPHDLCIAYQGLHSALGVAVDELSKLSDLALACSYAGSEIEMRLRELRGQA